VAACVTFVLDARETYSQSNDCTGPSYTLLRNTRDGRNGGAPDQRHSGTFRVSPPPDC